MFFSKDSHTKPPHKNTLPDIEDLFFLYGNDILRVCTVYLGQRALAEDAFQDVFVRVCSKGHTYKGDRPVLHWLLAIARNVCRDYLRSGWLNRVSAFEDVETSKKGKNVSQSNRISNYQTEERILAQINIETPLLKAVYALPPRYKDVILLRFYFDLTNDEIASLLHITESTVRSRLHRARQKLFPLQEGGQKEYVSQ